MDDLISRFLYSFQSITCRLFCNINYRVTIAHILYLHGNLYKGVCVHASICIAQFVKELLSFMLSGITLLNQKTHKVVV